MRCTCAVCDISFASVNDYQKHNCQNEWKNANKDAAGYQHYKEEKKMTREEAVKIVRNIGNAKPWYEAEVEQLEALGLLKFDEPKMSEPVVAVIVEVDENYNTSNNWNFYAAELVKKYERVRLELWPEGLVLWVGGEIRWKSWEAPPAIKIGDNVRVELGSYSYMTGPVQIYEGVLRDIKKKGAS